MNRIREDRPIAKFDAFSHKSNSRHFERNSITSLERKKPFNRSKLKNMIDKNKHASLMKMHDVSSRSQEP